MSSKVYVDGSYVPTRVQLTELEAVLLWRYAQSKGWSMQRAVGTWLRSMDNEQTKGKYAADHDPETQ